MEEASWKTYHGGGIIEEVAWARSDRGDITEEVSTVGFPP